MPVDELMTDIKKIMYYEAKGYYACGFEVDYIWNLLSLSHS